MTILPKQILGKDFNFFERVTVDGYTYADYADIQFKFRCSDMTFSLVWEGVGIIEYSFNGVNTHGDMESGEPTVAIPFDNCVVSGVWFRIKSGSGGTVRIEGWRVD